MGATMIQRRRDCRHPVAKNRLRRRGDVADGGVWGDAIHPQQQLRHHRVDQLDDAV